MTEDQTNAEEEVEMTEEEFEGPSIEVGISPPIEFSYNELCENFNEDMILADLEEVVKNRIRSLYDNQEEIRQRLAQAQQQQGGGPPGGM